MHAAWYSRSVGDLLVVFGDGGPHFFEDLAAASDYLEAIDVENGEYTAAYDQQGQRVPMSTKSMEVRFFWFWKAEVPEVIFGSPVPVAESEAAEAKKHLVGKLVSLGAGSEEELARLSWSELVALGYDKVG